MFDFLKQLKKDRPMRIVVNGHPALRKVSAPIADATPEIIELAKQLTRSLLESEVAGVGLAAPQIGVNLRMIVLKTSQDGGSRAGALPGELLLDPQMPVVLLNPEIVAFGEETGPYNEGCLSLPGISGEVIRPLTVTLRARLLSGQEFTAECGGLLARCLQHEIDHLDGKLFCDHLPPEAQKAAAPILRKLERREKGLRATQGKLA